MLAEVSIQPQVGRDIRREVTGALKELERAGLKHEVEPFGTAVEGDLEQILAALRAIHGRLSTEGIDRFELHVRIRQEPGVTSGGG
jgi:uncharacterized protein YqgV (UPF0045/DUF77 family)